MVRSVDECTRSFHMFRSLLGGLEKERFTVTEHTPNRKELGEEILVTSVELLIRLCKLVIRSVTFCFLREVFH